MDLRGVATPGTQARGGMVARADAGLPVTGPGGGVTT